MNRTALILAHGQPSAPEPAEAELAGLASAVSRHLPGWQVASATLAAPGALAAAISAKSPGLVLPLFMAGGWFTRVELPRRLGLAGGEAWHILPPFGLSEGLHELALALVRESCSAEVLLAAHGSFRSPAPSEVAYALAARIRDLPGIIRCEAAFIDQQPRLADTSGWGQDAICLPFFAMAGGHIRDDLPEALAQAGFLGRLLPPLGLDPRVPALIAGLLREGDGAAAFF